jgi:hypothetical protein
MPQRAKRKMSDIEDDPTTRPAPTLEDVVSMVNDLITEREIKGVRATGDSKNNVTRTYYVRYQLRDASTSQKVSEEAACDWRDGRSGPLPQMVDAAASELLRRRSAGGPA